MGHLFGIEITEVVRLRKQLEDSGFLDYIESCLSQIGNYGGPISEELGLLLYIAVRLLRPEVVVETGVGMRRTTWIQAGYVGHGGEQRVSRK